MPQQRDAYVRRHGVGADRTLAKRQRRIAAAAGRITCTYTVQVGTALNLSRIESSHTWDELVLPTDDGDGAELREIAARVAQRTRGAPRARPRDRRAVCRSQRHGEDDGRRGRRALLGPGLFCIDLSGVVGKVHQRELRRICAA